MAPTQLTQAETTQTRTTQTGTTPTEFTLETSAVTLAELDTDTCPRHVFLPGHLDAGAEVPCPAGDHTHVLLEALHTAVAENVQIIS